METNHDGAIDHRSFDHGVARPAEVSRTSEAPVGTHLRRDSDLRAAIDPAVPTVPVTTGRPAAQRLRAAPNTAVVPGVPATTDFREGIDIPQV